MENYIGAKIIRGEEMDECTFLKRFKNEDVSNRETMDGYHVLYPDGYHSWSPTLAFENAYRKITYGELRLLASDEPETTEPLPGSEGDLFLKDGRG